MKELFREDTLADYEAWKTNENNNNVGAVNAILRSSDKPDEVAGNLNLATQFGKETGNPVPPLAMVEQYRNVFQQMGYSA
jgi:hypothetical protein